MRAIKIENENPSEFLQRMENELMQFVENYFELSETEKKYITSHNRMYCFNILSFAENRLLDK